MFRSLALIYLICACVNASTTILQSSSHVKPIHRIRKRMINGWPIKIEEAPHTVSIINTTTGNHMCGGSIISPDYVLTAGHCADTPPADYNIRSGSTFSDRHGQIHEVERIHLHENFSMAFLGLPWNDVALMKVKPRFELDNITTKAVELVGRDARVQVGESGFLSGWGVTTSDGTTASEHLMAVNVNIIDPETCRKEYWLFGGAGENQFCTSHPDGNGGFCHGDSGGPFLINGRQAGIISWNLGCVSMPNVYTDLAAYRDWIDEHLMA